MAITAFGSQRAEDYGGTAFASFAQGNEQVSTEPFDNYNGAEAVSFEVWQEQLAFDRDGTGQNRETIARTRDAQEAYANYVDVWNQSDEETRRAIDLQHGFAFEPEVEAPSGGVGGGGPSADTSTEPFVERIEAAAEAPREEITPTPSGLEETPVVEATVESEGLAETAETVVAEEAASDPNYVDASSADDEIEEARVVNNFAPIEPSNIVVDPGTGQEFASPAAARAAGITNWVYKDDHKG